MTAQHADSQGTCETIYGPVRSRRQGLSLGVNLGSPGAKLCTWGCIYCQCGIGMRTDKVDDHPGVSTVIQRLVKALTQNPGIESVTFAGNSEPASHPEFLAVVREVLRIRERLQGKWTVNALSNGSELDRDDVREACDLLDECWVKLDCGTEDLYRRLNRPLERLGGVADQVARIRRLKQPRVQTLLWSYPSDPSMGNVSSANLDALLSCYRTIAPVEVHLTTVQRSPALKGIETVPEAELQAFAVRIRELSLRVGVFPCCGEQAPFSPESVTPRKARPLDPESDGTEGEDAG